MKTNNNAEPPSLGPVEHTHNGFEVVAFNDHYDHPCSLQASSLAIYEKPGTSAVWLGCNEADPKVMARDASAYGIKTNETTGWVPYPLPEGVLLTTRMHLNREQVEALIAHLQNWLERDTFEIDQ